MADITDMKRVNERRLVVTEGAEGPQHDPYSWTERTVIFNGHRITLRHGSLGYYRFSIDGRKLCQNNEAILETHVGRETTHAEDAWLSLTGFDSIEVFDRAYAHLNPRGEYGGDPMGHPSRYV